jgi:hypothetical protein
MTHGRGGKRRKGGGGPLKRRRRRKTHGRVREEKAHTPTGSAQRGAGDSGRPTEKQAGAPSLPEPALAKSRSSSTASTALPNAVSSSCCPSSCRACNMSSAGATDQEASPGKHRRGLHRRRSRGCCLLQYSHGARQHRQHLAGAAGLVHQPVYHERRLSDLLRHRHGHACDEPGRLRRRRGHGDAAAQGAQLYRARVPDLGRRRAGVGDERGREPLRA